MNVLSWWRGEGRAEEKTGTEDSLPGDIQDALDEQQKAIRAGFRTADQLAASALAIGAISTGFSDCWGSQAEPPDGRSQWPFTGPSR